MLGLGPPHGSTMQVETSCYLCWAWGHFELQGTPIPAAACLGFVDVSEILEKPAVQAKAGCLCRGAAGRGLGQTQIGWGGVSESPGWGKQC